MRSLSVQQAALAVPQREALFCAGERLDFESLARRSGARASELLAHGVEPRSVRPVALVVDNSVVMFEILHALIALGVPLLPLHPRLTGPERRVLLQLSDAQLVLDPATLDPSSSTHATTAVLPSEQLDISVEHPLAYVPTSGSSGTPKLVELSRQAFLALARADAARVPPMAGDRALLCLPLSHVGGLSVVLRSICERRTCCVFGARTGLLHATAELAQVLRTEHISLLSLVPPVLSRLLREQPSFAEDSSLRAVLVGGQPCAPELFDHARARGVPVLTSYGLTETCSQVSTLAYPPPTKVPARRGVSSSGLTLPGMELRVDAGVISVRGPSLFTRYLGRERALDQDGFFLTGDRGEYDSEFGLFVFGRESEVIITGGENVDPSEVEHALVDTGFTPSACVFGVPDAEFGEVVAAAVEVPAGTSGEEERLFRALDARLARFKQPRLLSWFQELPRLGSGKLDRSRIRAAASAGLHAPRRPR